MSKKSNIAIVLLASLFLLLGTFFVTYKSDFIYIGYEYFARLGRNYQMETVDVSGVPMLQTSFEDLDALKNTSVDESLLLINSRYKIPDLGSPELVAVGDKQIHVCAQQAFLALDLYVTERYGDSLRIASAYRTADHQQDVISTSKGDTAAAVGASEHQYGLGIDVGVEGYGGRAFLKTKIGRYVNSFCHEYGFIIRYPLESSEITGISYEPWHIRYVGTPHAEIIYKSGMTLEEYVDSLEIGEFYVYDKYWISRQDPDAVRVPENYVACHASLDNTGYCIVTVIMPE